MVTKYHLSLRVLHWLMALVILTLIAVGWYMTGLEDNDPLRNTLYPLHKSFGMLALLLVSIRILVRLWTVVPPLPKTFPQWVKLLSTWVHRLIYVFMFAIPLSGYTMSMAGGYGVKMFGLTVPNFLPKDKTIAGIAHTFHHYLPYILLGVLVLHIGGVIKHRFFDKEDVLPRML